MKTINLEDRIVASKLANASKNIVDILIELLQDEQVRPEATAGMLALQLGKLLNLMEIETLWPTLKKLIEEELK